MSHDPFSVKSSRQLIAELLDNLIDDVLAMPDEDFAAMEPEKVDGELRKLYEFFNIANKVKERNT